MNIRSDGAACIGTGKYVIFSGFGPDMEATSALPEICPGDFLACADSGFEVCISAGLRPDVVIGDFDSLSPDQSLKIEELGIEKIAYPSEKDDTDMMLCAKHGLSLGFERFLIVGGIGGDFSHTIANLQALSFLYDSGCSAMIVTETNIIRMTDGEKLPEGIVFEGRPGGRFSVFSYTEFCSGVYIQNAKYELTDAVLTHSRPLGAGNEFINTEPVKVSVLSGRLLVIIDRCEPGDNDT